MIEVEQETFSSIEKAETEDVVVGEGRPRADDDVEEAETARALGNCHLGAEGGVVVHVVDVVGQGGVGVVEEGVVERALGSRHLKRFVYCPVFHSTHAAAKQPKLGIWPKASMSQGTAKEIVLALKPIAIL